MERVLIFFENFVIFFASARKNFPNCSGKLGFLATFSGGDIVTRPFHEAASHEAG